MIIAIKSIYKVDIKKEKSLKERVIKGIDGIYQFLTKLNNMLLHKKKPSN